MKTSIATVSLSGSLTEKLHACAAAGFDGVEMFEPDLIANDHSPEEIRGAEQPARACRLDLYQPLRDIEGVDEDDLRRRTCAAPAPPSPPRSASASAPSWCCSNVATATVDSDEVSADQLRRLGDLAARIRHQGRVRGAGLGPVRRRLPPRLAHRRARRPPERRGVPGQFPRAVARARPRRDRGHPGRQDLLPATRRRARAEHGRALVEPPPPAVPRRGRLRPARPSSPTSWPPATTGRCRSRSSTTPSGRPTLTAPRCTPCARCAGCRTGPPRSRRGLAAPTSPR